MKINILETQCVYINLDEDIEKKNNVEIQLKEVGFKYIKRIPAFKGYIDHSSSILKWHQKSYANACVRSFLKALSACPAPLVIFEDDMVIYKNNLTTFIEMPDNCDFLYLGGSNLRYTGPHSTEYITLNNPFIQTDYKNILMINNGMTNLHAFVVLNENMRQHLIKELSKNTDIIQDYTISRMHAEGQYNFYACNPPIFRQDLLNSFNPYTDNLIVG